MENSVVAGINARLVAVEAAVAASRWRHINQGSQVGGNAFNITVPAGFQRLRLSLAGDINEVTESINVRLNGDASTSYIRGFLGWEANGVQMTPEHNASTSSVKVAEWGSVESNSCVVEIFPTDGTQNPNIRGYSTRISSSAAGHEVQFGWGKYQVDAVVSAVNVFTSGTFERTDWWLEGYLSP